jgi:hypothetical protein
LFDLTAEPDAQCVGLQLAGVANGLHALVSP